MNYTGHCVFVQEKKAKLYLFGYIKLGTVPCTFNNCILIVACSNLNITMVNMF
jgi:hypothetical protein